MAFIPTGSLRECLEQRPPADARKYYKAKDLGSRPARNVMIGGSVTAASASASAIAIEIVIESVIESARPAFGPVGPPVTNMSSTRTPLVVTIASASVRIVIPDESDGTTVAGIVTEPLLRGESPDEMTMTAMRPDESGIVTLIESPLETGT